MVNFPLNVNGKIDKNLLPTPTITTNENIISPRNKTDKTLVSILKKYLKLETVNLSNSFVELGGDSLSAINIIAEIENKLHVQLHIKDLLNMASIMDISDYIANTRTQNTAFVLEKAPKMDLYPLSSAQRRIYYACKMVGDDTLVYNTPCALLINSRLDSKRVEGAFKQIIEKQSSFRTVFVLDADEVKQKILDKVDFAISVFNNTSTEKDAIIKNFSKPFDLENAPLLRVELHYLDNNPIAYRFTPYSYRWRFDECINK